MIQVSKKVYLYSAENQTTCSQRPCRILYEGAGYILPINLLSHNSTLTRERRRESSSNIDLSLFLHDLFDAVPTLAVVAVVFHHYLVSFLPLAGCRKTCKKIFQS